MFSVLTNVDTGEMFIVGATLLPGMRQLPYILVTKDSCYYSRKQAQQFIDACYSW